MSIKDQVTPEQLKTLVSAPGAASTIVSMASGGAFETLKEVFSASKFAGNLAEKAGGSGYGPLVDDLLLLMKGMDFQDARENTVQFDNKDPASVRDELKKIIADAAEIVSALPGGDGFKRFLLDMARETAKTKTGGFLGIGAKSVVDDAEQSVLKDLAAILGL
jgi:glutaredoxin-related protein